MLARSWFTVAQRCLSTTSTLAVSTTPSLNKGHSKWQNIKATKGKNDMIKSQNMNFLLKKARSAASKGGFDIKLNKELAAVELEFKAKGLPLDTLKNFLQKMKDRPEVEVSFDLIGPSGTFFIITAETDNKKAVEQIIRKYINKVGGFRLATDSSGVRSWFEEKGVITIGTEKDGKALKLDEVEEFCIELECEEVSLIDDDGQKFEVICDPKRVNAVESELSAKGFPVETADLEFRPLHPVTVAGEDSAKIEKFYDLVQEDDSIKAIFDNIEPTPATMSATA